MRYLLLCLTSITSLHAVAQDNQLGKQIYGGSYTAPVLYKTYKVFSDSYQPPAGNSFGSTSYKYSGDAPKYATEQSSGSSSSHARVPMGTPFLGSNGKYGYKSGTGSIMVEPIYDELIPLHKGVTFNDFVRVKSGGKYGVLWPNNDKPTVPLIYDELLAVGYSYMLVKADGKMGLVKIEKPGKSSIAVPIKYDEMGSLDGGYAFWIKTGSKYGLTDIDNKAILDIVYDDINIFSPQTVVVTKNGKMGLMNYKGKNVLPVIYENISRVNNGAAWIIQGGKWGLISQEGAVLAAPAFDSVYQNINGDLWLNDLAVIVKDGQPYYLNTKGEALEYSAAVAEAARKFYKNNLYEDFSIAPSRFIWETGDVGKITAGSYQLTPVKYNSTYEEVPFPAEFSYTADDDWEMEVKLRQFGGVKIYGLIVAGWGFSWGNKKLTYPNNMLNQATIGGEGSMGNYFKINDGINTIKVTRVGKVISNYCNGKLIGTRELKELLSGTFYLSMDGRSESDPVLRSVYYYSIKFTILDKN